MQYSNSPRAKKKYKMSRWIFATIFATAIVFLGFQTYVYADRIKEKNTWGDTEISVVSSNIKFTLDLYRQLQKENHDSNIFFSPFSVSSALMMTMLGARGNTEQQMLKTFSLVDGLSRNDIHGTFKYILRELSKNSSEYLLHLANRAFVQKDYKILESFFAESEFFYDAKPNNLDFIIDTESSRKFINEWIEKQTVHKIKDLLQPGVLSPLTRLVLVNAIYFKGNWEKKFKESNTKPALFHVSEHETIEIDMMQQKTKFKNGYIDDLDCQVLELPYAGSSLKMVILLPKEQFGLRTLEEKLTPKMLNNLKSELYTNEIGVYLPKFKVTQEFSLGETLSALGMTDIFTQGADLSGITGERDLFVGHVLHKAFIEVNEEGSEAAAATAANIMMLSAQLNPRIFKADHPFIYFIQDEKTGAILFFGRYTKPESQKRNRTEL